MHQIVKRIFILAVIVIIIAGNALAASNVKAASPFTCGTTALDDIPSWPGTIECETGEDYIRWTFNGLPGQTLRFGYDFIAAQPVMAEMHTQVRYTKKICDGSNPGWSSN